MQAFEKVGNNEVCEEIFDFSKMVNDPVLLNDLSLIYIRNYFKDMNKNIKNKSFSASLEASQQKKKLNEYVNLDNNNQQSNLAKNFVKDECKRIPKIFQYKPELLLSIYKNLKIVKGEVSKPGLYLFDDKNDFNTLLEFAGVDNLDFILSPDKQTISIESKTLQLMGSVKFPSVFKYSENFYLSNVITTSDYLLTDTHPFFGVIVRKSKNTNVPKIISFNPSSILSKLEDIKLKPSDQIILFSTNSLDSTLAFIEKYKDINNKVIKSAEDEFKTEEDQILINKDDNKGNAIENSDIITENNFDENASLNEKLSDAQNESFVSDLSNENISRNESEINKSSFLSNDEMENNQLLVCQDLETIFHSNKNLCNKIINEVQQSIISVSGKVISPGKIVAGDYVDVNELISFSGGFSIDANKVEIEVSNALPSLQNSRYVYPKGGVFVSISEDYKENIKLMGEFRENRELSFKPTLKLSSILSSTSQIKNDSYLHFATIQRSDNEYNKNTLIPFSPIDVIKGSQDTSLRPGDIIKIYKKEDLNKILESVSKESDYQTPELEFDKKTNLPKIQGDLKELVKSLSLRVEGAVVKPDKIIIASSVTLEKVIEIIGGLNNEANSQIVEVVYPKKDNLNNFVLNTRVINFDDKTQRKEVILPGSLIRVPKVDNDLSLGFIELSGAVVQPGKYQILKGDSIFEIIKRSGGLSDDAYLKGLVFSRIKEQKGKDKPLKDLKGIRKGGSSSFRKSILIK